MTSTTSKTFTTGSAAKTLDVIIRQGLNDKITQLKKKITDEKSLLLIDSFINKGLFLNGLYQLEKHNLTNIDINMMQALKALSPKFEHESIDNKNYIYTEEVLKLIKKYDLEDTMEVCYYHSGLKCLSDEVLLKLSGKDFIDGGAYTGDGAFVYSEYDFNKIYAFEAIESVYNKLNTRIKQYHLEDRIKPVNLGLSDKVGTAEIISLTEGIDGTSMNPNYINAHKDKHQTYTINTVTIDSFVEENNLNLGVIKLDVEGVESMVIDGSIESIKKYKPVLLISIYHNMDDFFNIKPVIENLDLGYKFLIRHLYHAPLKSIVHQHDRYQEKHLYSSEYMLIAYC